MSVDVTLPKLGLTMEEAVVEKWHRRVGERVEQGEELVDIETDKIRTAIEAPVSGVLREIIADEGAEVLVGETLARIDPK